MSFNNDLELDFAELFTDDSNSCQSIDPFAMEEPDFVINEPEYDVGEYEEPEDIIFNDEQISMAAQISNMPDEDLIFESKTSVVENDKLNKKADTVISEESEKLFEQAKAPSYNNINAAEKEENRLKSKVVIEDTVPDFNNMSNNTANSPKFEKKEEKNSTDYPNEIKDENKANSEEQKANNNPNLDVNKDSIDEVDKKIEFDMSIDDEWFERMFKEEDYYNVNYSAENDYGEYMSDDEYNNLNPSDDIDIVENIENAYANENIQEVKSKKIKEKRPITDIIPQKYKNILVFIIMLCVLLGVPVISAIRENKDGNKKNKVNTNNYQVDSEIYEKAKEQSNQDNQDASNNSGRFTDISELTLYIESTSGSLLSSEMQAVNKYNAGSITKKEFLSLMEGYIEEANNLNHLLLINEPEYIKQDMKEKYNEMFENIKTLLVYGDTAVLNIGK